MGWLKQFCFERWGVKVLIFFNLDGGKKEQHSRSAVFDAHDPVGGRKVAKMRDAHVGVECRCQKILSKSLLGRASRQGKHCLTLLIEFACIVWFDFNSKWVPIMRPWRKWSLWNWTTRGQILKTTPHNKAYSLSSTLARAVHRGTPQNVSILENLTKCILPIAAFFFTRIA